MDDNNFQQDLFSGSFREKKDRRPGLFDGYSKQRFLPYVKIPIEYTVIIAIGMLVLMIISYAVGVERGKRVSKIPAAVATKTVIKEPGTSEAFSSKTASMPQEEKVSLVETEDLVEEVDVKDIDPYEGSRDDYVGAPPEEPLEEIKESVYTVQLASFKSADSAKGEIDKLKRQGIQAEMSKPGDWYQVYASGYQTIEEARSAQKKLREYYQDCYIRKVK